MEIEQLIRRYSLSLGTNPKTGEEGLMANLDAVKRDNARNEIAEKKQQIMAYLKAERAEKEREAAEAKRKEQERQERIAAIEGLKEIQDAIEDLNRWHYEFEKSFEDVGGLGVRPKPQYDLEAMRAKFHHADAYLRAEEEALKSNYELSAIGKKALDEVIFGDYKKAMENMDAEIKAFVDRHIWD